VRLKARERAARVDARRVGLWEQGARGAGGHVRRAGARSEQHRVGHVRGDGYNTKCGVSGRTVPKRAMGEEVGKYFLERKMWEV
jgi:hypothetical protein